MPTTTAPTAAEFKTLFPQFAAIADGPIEAWFVQAALRWTAVLIGTQWAMANYLYAAHQLSEFSVAAGADNSEDNVSRGPLSSERVGDLARGYGPTVDMAKVPQGLMWLTGTTYGQQLIGIITSRSAAHSRVIRTGSSRPGAIR